MGEAMALSVHVENNAADFAALQSHMYELSRWTQVILFITSMAVGTVAAAILLFVMRSNVQEEIPPLVSALFGFPFGFIVACQVLTQFQRSRAKRMISPGGSFSARTEFMIHQDVLHITGQFHDAKVAWSGILRIAQTKTHLYFFIDRVMAYSIPLRCFVSTEAAAEFVATAQKYVDAARAVKA